MKISIKQKIICIAFAMAFLCPFFIIGLIITQSDNECLRYENYKLKEMNNIIVNYSNSTTDTGEFDEFMQSKAGQNYFKLYKELYGEK